MRAHRDDDLVKQREGRAIVRNDSHTTTRTQAQLAIVPSIPALEPHLIPNQQHAMLAANQLPPKYYTRSNGPPIRKIDGETHVSRVELRLLEGTCQSRAARPAAPPTEGRDHGDGGHS